MKLILLISIVPAVLSKLVVDYDAQHDGDFFHVEVKRLDITKPGVEIEVVAGEQASLDRKVTIRIIKQICRYFPAGFEKYSTNIAEIHVHQSHLKVITANDLKPFSKLKVLTLTFNQLTTLEPKLFASNPNLQKIFLNDNHLSKISVDIFDYFEDIVRIELGNNDCIKKESTYLMNSNKIMREIGANCQAKTQDDSGKYIAMYNSWLESIKDPKEFGYLLMMLHPPKAVLPTFAIMTVSISTIYFWRNIYKKNYAVGG